MTERAAAIIAMVELSPSRDRAPRRIRRAQVVHFEIVLRREPQGLLLYGKALQAMADI